MSTRTRLAITLPEPHSMRMAPERSALAVLDVALVVAEHALHAEHPTLDDSAETPRQRVTPTLVAASLLARRCDELRELLAAYDFVLRDALGEDDHDDDDIPF